MTRHLRVVSAAIIGDEAEAQRRRRIVAGVFFAALVLSTGILAALALVSASFPATILGA